MLSVASRSLVIFLVACSPLFAEEPRVVITQEDEARMGSLIEQFNDHIEATINPFSSSIPFVELMDCNAYGQLLECHTKLLPYLIKQCQLEQEARVWVGAALADRRILSLKDLYAYQGERAGRLRSQVPFWVEWPGNWMLLPAVAEEMGLPFPSDGAEPLCLTAWWEQHQQDYEFKTAGPLEMEVDCRFYSHTHVSTRCNNGYLSFDAVGATYSQIIERTAAEMGIEVFIGEQFYMDILTTLRMRAVTFEEFAYLIGLTVSLNPFEYRKVGDAYHFGGETEAPPRPIMKGWGIMMSRTVFTQGQPVPVTIITRGTEPLVDPCDPVFHTYGSFRVTDNRNDVIMDYQNQTREPPTLPLLNREKDGVRIALTLPGATDLAPGEYNITFQYGSHVTPSIAFEIYPKDEIVSSARCKRSVPDLNFDQKVDFHDYSLCTYCFGQAQTKPYWCEQSDLDGSGDVGLGDLMILCDHWLAEGLLVGCENY